MRQPKPWFRASKNAWYIDHRGKKYRLGGHPEDAPPPKKTKAGWNVPTVIMDEFYRLMASDPANLPKPDKMPLATLCDLFLDHSQKQHHSETYTGYCYFLQSFCKTYAREMAGDIKPFHITRWLDDHPKWKGARRHAVLAIKRVYSWADKQGIFSPNPLRNVSAERGKARTRVLTKEEQTQILEAIPDDYFQEFVQAMLETGCRPSEVARVTASQVDLEKGVWEFDDHKTAKKTQKPRVVYLTPNMVELSKKLMDQYPEGPLFRGPRSPNGFNRHSIRSRFARLREKLPHLKHFVCYNLRHTFATQALVKGVGVAQVAQLLGHTSTEMVSKTYGHLADQIAHMREAAKKAVE